MKTYKDTYRAKSELLDNEICKLKIDISKKIDIIFYKIIKNKEKFKMYKIFKSKKILYLMCIVCVIAIIVLAININSNDIIGLYERHDIFEGQSVTYNAHIVDNENMNISLYVDSERIMTNPFTIKDGYLIDPEGAKNKITFGKNSFCIEAELNGEIIQKKYTRIENE